MKPKPNMNSPTPALSPIQTAAPVVMMPSATRPYIRAIASEYMALTLSLSGTEYA